MWKMDPWLNFLQLALCLTLTLLVMISIPQQPSSQCQGLCTCLDEQKVILILLISLTKYNMLARFGFELPSFICQISILNVIRTYF